MFESHHMLKKQCPASICEFLNWKALKLTEMCGQKKKKKINRNAEWSQDQGIFNIFHP